MNLLFGTRIAGGSAGFTTTIEFFGILGGVYSHGDSNEDSTDISQRILPDESKVPIVSSKRNSCDFARRYAWEPKGADADLKIQENEVFQNVLTNLQDPKHDPLRGLIRALAIPQRPGAIQTHKERTWSTAYLYPYSRELMHWDVRRKKGVVDELNMERNTLRGAGALVHKILRTDQNQERLGRNRQNLKEILEPTLATDSLLSRFNGRNIDSAVQKDTVERDAFRQGLLSEDLLCRVVDNVLSKPNLDKFTKVNHLMHLMPLAIMTHVLRASRTLISPDQGNSPPFFSAIVDFGFRSSQLRRESRSSLQQASKDCKSAIEKFAELKHPANKDYLYGERNLIEDEKEFNSLISECIEENIAKPHPWDSYSQEDREKAYSTLHAQGHENPEKRWDQLFSAAQVKKFSRQAVSGGASSWNGFYVSTASAIGFLNSYTGNRYHVIKDSLLEALVAAELDQGQREMTLKQFCKQLFVNWGMVIDKDSAQKVGLLERMNGESFEVNEKEHFTKPLRRLGLLREFSDQTLMVSLPE